MRWNTISDRIALFIKVEAKDGAEEEYLNDIQEEEELDGSTEEIDKPGIQNQSLVICHKFKIYEFCL